MNKFNEREAQEGIHQTWLVRGKETATQPDAYSNSGQSPESHFSGTEHEQVRSNRNNIERSHGTHISKRSDNSGKILERLEFVETAFISYVKGHQERLEVRLSDSRQREEEFKKAIQELKRDIGDLLSKDKTEEITEEL